MGKIKGKPVFPVFILLLMVFSFSHISPAAKAETSIETETGEIRVDDALYQFEKNSDFLKIFDNQNHLVFSSSCQDDASIILNLGFSQVFHSFFRIILF